MGLQSGQMALGKRLQLLPVIIAVFALVVQPFYGPSVYATSRDPFPPPVLLSPTNNAVVDGKTLSNKWSPVPEATKYIYESYNDGAATKKRHTEITTDTQKSATNVSHGTMFWWRTKAVNARGQESSWSALWKVTIDTTVPSTPTGGLPNNQFLKTNSFDFTWDASTDDQPGITYELQSAQANIVDADNSLIDAWKSIESNDSEQNYLPNPRMPYKGAHDGKWYWQVRAVDAAGNKSAWSDVWDVTLDTKAPKLKVKQPKNGQIFGDETTRTIVVEAYLEDEQGLANYNISIEPQVAESNMRLMAKDQSACALSAKNDSEVSLTICTMYDATEFYNGKYKITAWVEDKAGNRTIKTRTIVIRDEAAPILSTTLENNDTLSDVTALTVSAEEANPKVYTVRILDSDDKVVVGKNGELQELHDPNRIERSFTYNWDTSNVYDGEYKVQFSAIDTFGNESMISRLIRVDNTPEPEPEMPTVVITEREGRTVKGTVSHASATLAVLIDGKEADGIVIQRTAGGFRWAFVLPEEFISGKLQVAATLDGLSGYSEAYDFNFSPIEEAGNGATGTNSGLIQFENDLLRPFTVPASLRASLVTNDQSGSMLIGSDILGAETKSPEVDRNIKMPAIAATESGWKIFGLAWYWWLGLAVMLMLILWLVVSTMKHHADSV